MEEKQLTITDGILAAQVSVDMSVHLVMSEPSTARPVATLYRHAESGVCLMQMKWSTPRGDLSVPTWVTSDVRVQYAADSQGKVYGRGDGTVNPGRKPGMRLGSFAGEYEWWPRLPAIFTGSALVWEATL